MTEKSNLGTSLAPSAKGRSQQGRTNKALSREFFLLEPRTVEQWLAYLARLAKRINYINEHTGLVDGNWQALLPEPKKLAQLATWLQEGQADEDIKQLASRPDLALLLTFIDLLQHSNQQFNDFVARHLDYYYHDVLHFEHKAATPDNAHLVLTLNNVDALTLPAGTEFDGGKDSSGKPLIYQTNEVATFTRASVDYVASMNKVKRSSAIAMNRNVLLDVANGVELNTGSPSFGQLSNDPALAPSQVGFKLASEDLFLQGGHRTITLEFYRDKEGNEPLNLSTWPQWFDLSLSTADAEVLLTPDVWGISADGRQLKIVCDAVFPAIAPLDSSPIGANRALPFISLVLKPVHYQTLYSDDATSASFMAQLVIKQAKLTVAVAQLAGVIASSDSGNLDTNKPIEPFGSAPRLATKLHFTHPELVTKNILAASVQFSWVDRPENFDTHYKTYSYFYSDKLKQPTFDTNGKVVAGQYTFDPRYLDVGNTCSDGQSCDINSLSLSPLLDASCGCLVWPASKVNIYQSDKVYQRGVSTPLSANLFYHYESPHAEPTVLPLIVNNVSINQIYFTLSDNNAKRTYEQLPFSESSATAWPKWYSLELTGQDFGHKDYAQVSEYFAYQNSKAFTQNKDSFTAVQVPAPYLPVSAELLINYQAQSVICCGAQTVGNDLLLEHIAPIGRPMWTFQQQEQVSLLPRFTEFGHLYLAIANVRTPGAVRVFFQIDPVDGYNMGHSPKFVWEYYSAGQWWRFKRENSQGEEFEGRILSDSTFDLLDSGLIEFYLPKLANQTQFNHDGKLWLRATLDHQNIERPPLTDETKALHPIYSSIRGVFAQGVAVTLSSVGNAQTHFEAPLPAQRIAKLRQADPRVATINQPFASFGAKVAETQSQFDRRVSERIGHRQRLQTARDYELFVLEAYPQLHTVRAVSSDNALSLVVIPLNHDQSILQPKVPRYLKRKIQSRVDQLIAPNLEVKVDDPNYVEVQIELIVKIFPQYDIQTSVIELNQMVVDMLTPWNKPNRELVQSIYLSALAQRLEQHPAVDMIQVIRATRSGHSEKLYSIVTPDKPNDILVPARNHKISLASQLGGVFEGIGKWELEYDFIVQ